MIDAGGQRVGLDLLLRGEALHRRRPAPVTADDAGDQAFVGEAADAGALAVADAEGVDDGEVARMPGREEARLDGAEHRVGFEQPAARAGDGDRRAVADLGRRRGGGDLPHIRPADPNASPAFLPSDGRRLTAARASAK